jgi:hypothetical protein
MSLAQRLYDHGQELLVLSWDCRDDELAASMRRIAHALLETAYTEDEVVAVPAPAPALCA